MKINGIDMEARQHTGKDIYAIADWCNGLIFADQLFVPGASETASSNTKDWIVKLSSSPPAAFTFSVIKTLKKEKMHTELSSIQDLSNKIAALKAEREETAAKARITKEIMRDGMNPADLASIASHAMALNGVVHAIDARIRILEDRHAKLSRKFVDENLDDLIKLAV